MNTPAPQSKVRSSSAAARSATKTQSAKSKPDVQSRIAVAAYYKAQARGFAPGYELEDWLAAEKEENQ